MLHRYNSRALHYELGTGYLTIEEAGVKLLLYIVNDSCKHTAWIAKYIKNMKIYSRSVGCKHRKKHHITNNNLN